jgi:hypothetical protein
MAREAGEITSCVKATHPAVCSSVLGLGVKRANADPEHLYRRPSVNTNSQELATARALALVAVDEQLDEVTWVAGPPPRAASDASGDLERAVLPHPAAATANRTAATANRTAATARGARRGAIAERYAVSC